MEPIDVTDTWHFRFLSFMGDRGRVLYNKYNTCSYVRLMAKNLIYAALGVSIAFLLGFTVVFNAAVLAIFVSVQGISHAAFSGAMFAMPMVLGVIFLVQVLFAAGALILLVIFAVVWAVLRCQERIMSLEPIRAAINESSTYQIISAWHDKICRPIIAKR